MNSRCLCTMQFLFRIHTNNRVLAQAFICNFHQQKISNIYCRQTKSLPPRTKLQLPLLVTAVATTNEAAADGNEVVYSPTMTITIEQIHN